MARVTHVAKAQQKYETVPVLDADGNPKKTPVMKSVKDHETGEITQVQKVTKKGKPVFLTVTKQDRSKPKPLETCTACQQPIEVGTPYKWIAPKSGPYGGRRMARHEGCANWQVWDYSSSLSAQLSQVSYDFSLAVDQAESPDDVTSALSDAASAITDIAEQKRESASNIEEGFGHATSQSEELESTADSLEEWAQEIETADVPDMTACEECDDGQMDCDDCQGTGKVETDESAPDLVECDECSGTGTVDCEVCDGTSEDIDAWREEVRDNLTIVEESPV
jgi:hypothetical protein